MNAQEPTSTRPYLIRAINEWCTDNGFTPYLAVKVDKTVQVPREYVNDGEIVLNVSYDATSGLQMGNEFIEFKARFGGKPREIMIPVDRVIAVYARESGQGMSFPVIDEPQADQMEVSEDIDSAELTSSEQDPSTDSRVVQLVPSDNTVTSSDDEEPPRPPAGGGRPALKLVK